MNLIKIGARTELVFGMQKNLNCNGDGIQRQIPEGLNARFNSLEFQGL
jgi:hypothetical protein